MAANIYIPNHNYHNWNPIHMIPNCKGLFRERWNNCSVFQDLMWHLLTQIAPICSGYIWIPLQDLNANIPWAIIQ